MSASYRINKYLALAGIGSRRYCDRLVQKNRVKKNGVTVSSPAERVSDDDIVEVDGKKVSRNEEKIYLMLNKPRGSLTTVKDPQGRTTVMAYIQDFPYRIFPVGRLDSDSEGLLLLTNDGEVAYILTHPRFQVEKRYLVYTSCGVTQQHFSQMRTGIHIRGETYRIQSGKTISSNPSVTLSEVILTEGKKHEVRILFDSVDCPVLRLVRLSMGPLRLDEGLLPGHWRSLTQQEKYELCEYVKEKKHGEKKY